MASELEYVIFISIFMFIFVPAPIFGAGTAFA